MSISGKVGLSLFGACFVGACGQPPVTNTYTQATQRAASAPTYYPVPTYAPSPHGAPTVLRGYASRSSNDLEDRLDELEDRLDQLETDQMMRDLDND
jgi:hypothetical protein